MYRCQVLKLENRTVPFFTSKDIEQVVELTRFSASLRYNPRAVAQQDIEDILKKAL